MFKANPVEEKCKFAKLDLFRNFVYLHYQHKQTFQIQNLTLKSIFWNPWVYMKMFLYLRQSIEACKKFIQYFYKILCTISRRDCRKSNNVCIKNAYILMTAHVDFLKLLGIVRSKILTHFYSDMFGENR